ncbi:SAM-dependent methyltransferase [Roseovarius sp. MBR-78]|jgi:SAM-dependent methyltransferase
MSDLRQTSAMQIIATALADGNCENLLDIGCGSGGLKPHIEKLGIRWTGVDPAVAESTPDLETARAESLPFASGAFDSVLFLNSLHHVAIDEMPQALRESLRVLAPGRGPVIVIEPAVDGELSEILRHVDDETTVRAAAQSALEAIVEEGGAQKVDAYEYVRNERYVGIDDFVSRIAAADPSRKDAMAQNRPWLEKQFYRLSRRGACGYILRQPMRVTLLTLS